MNDLRWSAPASGGLFELGRRTAGKGEYRGLTFHETEAKSILNRVPGNTLPFDWTVNPYRGCSHACVYCLAGDTPILMPNGQTKPLAEVQVGDLVYGTTGEGRHRRYTVTPVLDHWRTVKPAYRITLQDGTQLVASGDHRFLTDRGWKFVTGTEQGADRRPHLTTSNRLLGVGSLLTTPPATPDYRRGYLCGLIRGDGHVGSYRYSRPGRAVDDHHRFRLALVDSEPLERGRAYLEGLGIPTTLFEFGRASANGRAMQGIRTQKRADVDRISDIIAWPERPSREWRRGFLGGIFDAEGSWSDGTIRISNADPVIIEQSRHALRSLGFVENVDVTRRANGAQYVRILGGLPENLRFFQTLDTAILRKRSIAGRAVKNKARTGIASIERLGASFSLYDITTGTGDFIANGVISHNCFARPTHEYLGFNTGTDFDREIVVKVNATELARAETAPGRWAGDLVAMGTNTDPYQAAEGKYKLTRGIIEVFTERGNPFSVLTKSTLVLRDLELYVEASKVTDVTVSFSIGTLDPDVWRQTEPGTPHPKRRLDALAKLADAGISTGVLIAPILPGMSDHPDQVEEVRRQCIAAGAESVSTIRLHLRPGVKEHFMGWLDTNRPDLSERYRRLYRDRAYLTRPSRPRTPSKPRPKAATQPTLPFG